MHWLFLTRHAAPKGGLESLSRELLLAILERGDTADVAVYLEDVYSDIVANSDGRCRRADGPPIEGRKLTPAAVMAAARFIRRQRPDAIFYCNPGIPDFFPFAVAAGWCGVKHVVAHHGNLPEFPRAKARKRHWGGILPGMGFWLKRLKWEARWAARNVTLAMFHTDEQADWWERELNYPAGKRGLWLAPVDLARFAPDRARGRSVRESSAIGEGFLIGTVGRFIPEKSHDLLIRAFARVAASHPRTRLVIAGDGPLRGSLESLVTELDLANRVTLGGPEGDPAAFLNGLDLFVLSSTSETLGIATLEAMACGVPCLVTDLAGPKRLAGNGEFAHVVRAGSVDDLADGLERLLSDAARRTDLAEAGRRRALECRRDRLLEALLARMKGAPSSPPHNQGNPHGCRDRTPVAISQ
jgi:glycosyltransferase involved in cell wall biosynthesis